MIGGFGTMSGDTQMRTVCMPTTAPGSRYVRCVYHVLNRSNGQLRLFKKEVDFAIIE
jgi:hypothetical protein